VVLDADHGVVVRRPTRSRIEAANQDRQRRQQAREAARARRNETALTTDGHRVTVLVNAATMAEAIEGFELGAEGIGLLRTEFLFMNRADLPDEDEQYQALRDIVRGLDGRPITVRTLDIGGDKLADALDGLQGGGANPALGLRAIRLSLKQPHLLETQLAAILRAAAHGPVRILLPMISSIVEIRQVREIMKTVVRRLKRRGVRLPHPLPPLGVMIEVPGAALAADALAQSADFFAIGTNDLTMYTLAIDRGDEQVAHLYNPLHPAVLRLIQFTTEAALRARIPISVCGEIAGDPRYAALLIGLGIRELSMATNALPRVKQRIRNLDIVAATRFARVIMDQSDTGRIATLLDDFNALA
jgi:phosphoenolpyruvate-protein phosphotransferase (PTS system enzyme I)